MSAELATYDETPVSPIADAPIPAVEEEAAPAAEAGSEQPATAEPEQEPEKQPEKDEDDNPFKRRIDRLTAKQAEALQEAARARQEAAELRAQLAALNPEAVKPEPGQDPIAVAREQLKAEAAAEEFNRECNMTHAKGVAEFPDFERSLTSLQTLGVMNPTVINAALEAGDAHKVLYALGKAPEEAERIANLPPERMGAAIAKFALKAVPALAAKPVSRAPEPIKPISGGAATGETDPSKMSMEEFEKKFPLPSRH